MTVSLKNTFLANARGFTLKDSASVTWSINYNTNEISATASSTGVSGANPTAKVGLAAINGSATTFLRSDGAPPVDQGIAPTWTGVHTFSASTSGFGGSASGYTVTPNYWFQQPGVVNVGIRDTTDGTELLLRCDSSGTIFGAMTNSPLFIRTNNVTRITLAGTGAVTVAGNLAVNGATPPAMVTGWGTPTGASVQSNFSGSAATLAQCSAAIAKIITDLKALGFYGN